MKLLFSLLFLSTYLQAYIFPDPTPVRSYLKDLNIEHVRSGMKNVDCIYVINLDERKEKWQRVSQHLHSFGLTANRAAAINGWKLPTEVLDTLAGHYPPRRLTPGRSGCILSHLSVIKDALEKNFQVVWIMEDDILVKENPLIFDNMISILNHLNPAWDILFTDLDSKDPNGKIVPSLGSDFRPDGSYPPLQHFTWRHQVSKDLMQIRQRFGAYSYIVSRNGLKKLYDYLTHVYFWTAYDMDMHYTPNIIEYASIREIVTIWHECRISDTTHPVTYFDIAASNKSSSK